MTAVKCIFMAKRKRSCVVIWIHELRWSYLRGSPQNWNLKSSLAIQGSETQAYSTKAIKFLTQGTVLFLTARKINLFYYHTSFYNWTVNKKQYSHLMYSILANLNAPNVNSVLDPWSWVWATSNVVERGRIARPQPSVGRGLTPTVFN